MRYRGRVWLFGGLAMALALGGARASTAPAAGAPSGSIQAVTPIFSQLIAWHLPLRFHGVNEQATQRSYLFEAVPQGQTTDQWSEMITLTGMADAASDETLTPDSVIVDLGAGFKKACPDTFSAGKLDAPDIGGYAAFAAVISCGQVGSAAGLHSETAMILAIKGRQDYYTLQWAKRGPPQATPIKLDAAPWHEALAQLLPVWLCDKTSGEVAPYPSCLHQDPTLNQPPPSPPEPAAQHDTSRFSEERSAASGFAGTMNYYIGKMASACRPILGAPDTYPKALIDTWRQHADNDLYFRTAARYEALLIDAVAGSSSEDAARKVALDRVAVLRRDGDDLVHSQLAGNTDENAARCRRFEQNVRAGRFDFTRTTPHYQTLSSMAEDLGLTH